MSTFREENIRYLRPLWIRLAVIYALAVPSVGWMLYQIALTPTWILGFWPLIFAFAFAIRLWRRALLARTALNQPTADAAARKLYGKLVTLRGFDYTPFIATGIAQLHVVYGNFERAAAVLAPIAWDKFPPLVRGDHDFVQGLAALVQGDARKGQELARRATPLFDLPKLAPGSSRTRRAVAMLNDLGDLMADDSRAAAGRLAVFADKRGSAYLHRGVVAWALSRAEERWGNPEKAAAWLAKSRKLLPHGYGLGVPRPAETRATPVVLDLKNPYAAPSADAIDEAPFVYQPRAWHGWWRVGLMVFAGVMIYVGLRLLRAH